MENKKEIGKIILLFIVAFVLTFVLAGVKKGVGFIKHKDTIMFGVNVTNESNNKVFEGLYDPTYEIIYFHIDAGNVEIKESSDNFIHITIFSDDDYSYVYEEENELSIISLHENEKLNNKDKANKIIVEMPNDYAGTFDINLDYGNITMDSFDEATVSSYLECGNIQIKSIKNVDISNRLGDTQIGNIHHYCNIYNSCGNIEIRNFNVMEDSYIYDDLGNIIIYQINNVYIEANTELGKVDVGSNPLSQIVLTIHNSCGNIEVNNKTLEL